MAEPRMANIRQWTWLVLSIFCAASMWCYVNQIWNANQAPQFSDLYAPWWATRELLMHERNPYTPAVAHEIQSVIYGAPSGKSPNDPGAIAGGFAYPLHVTILLAPVAKLSFPVVRMLFVLLSPLLILVSLGSWLYALQWQIGIREKLTLSIFAVGSFPAVQAMKLQNLSVLAAALIITAIACIVSNRLAMAGILLGIATFKPQFVFLLLLWLASWIATDWRARRKLARGFIVTIGLLFCATELLLPGWVRDFVRVALAYRRYTYGHSLFDIWFTQPWGVVIAGTLLLFLAATCWEYRSVSAHQVGFVLICGLLLATTLVVIPSIEPHAQLLLIPCFMVLVLQRSVLFGSAKSRLFFSGAALLIGWEWAGASILILASLWLSRSTILGWWLLPLYTSPLIPLAMLPPIFLAILNSGSSTNQSG